MQTRAGSWIYDSTDLETLPPTDDDLFVLADPAPVIEDVPVHKERTPRRVLLLALAVLVISAADLGWVGARVTNRRAAPPPATSALTPPTLAPQVMSASALTLVPISSAPTCAEAVLMHDPAVLLAAFRAARLRGHGAAGCTTNAALAAYCDDACTGASFSGFLGPSPGPICLYHCWVYRVSAIADQAGDPNGDSSYRWHVTLVSSDGTAADSDEALVIGPGRPSDSNVGAAQVITAAAPAA